MREGKCFINRSFSQAARRSFRILISGDLVLGLIARKVHSLHCAQKRLGKAAAIRRNLLDDEPIKSWLKVGCAILHDDI